MGGDARQRVSVAFTGSGYLSAHPTNTDETGNGAGDQGKRGRLGNGGEANNESTVTIRINVPGSCHFNFQVAKTQIQTSGQ
jgi:hypothetical protein